MCIIVLLLLFNCINEVFAIEKLYEAEFEMQDHTRTMKPGRPIFYRVGIKFVLEYSDEKIEAKEIDIEHLKIKNFQAYHSILLKKGLFSSQTIKQKKDMSDILSLNYDNKNGFYLITLRHGFHEVHYGHEYFKPKFIINPKKNTVMYRNYTADPLMIADAEDLLEFKAQSRIIGSDCLSQFSKLL